MTSLAEYYNSLDQELGEYRRLVDDYGAKTKSALQEMSATSAANIKAHTGMPIILNH